MLGLDMESDPKYSPGHKPSPSILRIARKSAFRRSLFQNEHSKTNGSKPSAARRNIRNGVGLEDDRTSSQDASDADSQKSNCKAWPRCNRSWYWWEPSEDCLAVEFFRNTSLHGLRYVGQEKRHLCERIFWSIVFMLGIAAACVLIYGLWDKYQDNPIIISFLRTETTIYQIPFPAITICNINNVLRSKVEGYLKHANGNPKDYQTQEALKNLYYVNQVCSAEARSFSQKFGFVTEKSTVPAGIINKTRLDAGDKEQNDVKNFLREAAQPCEDMILRCLWEDSAVNCMELFQEIETDYGKCCTFNMVPPSLLYQFENESKADPILLAEWKKSALDIDSLLIKNQDEPFLAPMYPRRIRRAGKSYGLSLLLNPGLDEYFCTTADSVGFQLATHLPIEVPHVSDYGMGIRPNSEVFLGVLPDVTTAEADIHDFALEKRDCYFQGEYTLKYYSYYTVTNCIDECVANLSYTKCGCVLYYMLSARDDNRSLCGPNMFKCTDDLTKGFTRTGFKGYCTKCLPTCTQISYWSESSVTPMRSDVKTWISGETGELADWSNKNLSILHVYFRQDSTYPKVRKSLYGFTDLIANTGGLLGLCLGFSALSAMEFIYFLTLRACCRKRLRKHILERVATEKRELKPRRRRVSPLIRGYTPTYYSRRNSTLPVVSITNAMTGFDTTIT